MGLGDDDYSPFERIWEMIADKFAYLVPLWIARFIHRREVIEGALSQFTGAYVKTVSNEDSESYYVVLKQEGMFLTGVSEQTFGKSCRYSIHTTAKRGSQTLSPPFFPQSADPAFSA